MNGRPAIEIEVQVLNARVYRSDTMGYTPVVARLGS